MVGDIVADGRIILQTKVDTSGIKKGESDIKKALSSGNAEVKKAALNYQKATAEVEKQTKKVAELKQQIATINSGGEVKNATITGLSKQLEKVNNDIEKTKQRISTIYTELDRIQSQAFVSPDTNEPLLTGSEQAQFDKLYAELDILEPKLASNRQKSTELGIAIKNAVGAETNSRLSNLNAQLTETETKLTSAQIKANVAGTTLNTKMGTVGKAVKSVGSGFNKMGSRIGGLIKSALLFTVITKAFTALRDTIGSVIMKDEQFVQSLNALKSSLWTAASPIISVIIPALKTLVNWLAIVMTWFGKFVAMITGKSYTDMQKSGAGFAKQAKDAKTATSAQKGLNKEMEKTTAAFDELNILQSTDTSSGDSGGGGTGTSADIGAATIQDPAEQISTKLQALMGIAGGALAAIGLVLLFTGHSLIGAGFLIAGAAMLGVGIPAIGQIFNEGTIQQKLLLILGIIGGALIAIGVILLLTGAGITWGLGFIIAGAAAFGVSAINLSDKLTPELRNKINTWIAIASGSMLALGIILCVCGVVNPLSIGLIVAGAIGLAAEIALNWGAITTAVSDFFKNNAGLIVGVAVAVLAIVLLIFAPHIALGLAVALLVMGMTTITAEASTNEGEVKNKISNFFSENSALFVGIGLALIVLGIICLFTGVGIPLGLGLLLAGGASLAAAIAPNWGLIKQKVSEVWQSIKDFWNNNIAKWFKVQTWKDLVAKIGKGLKDGFKAAINGVIGIVEKGMNWIIKQLNKVSFDIPDWVPGVGGKKFGFDINELSIPRLAKGAVLPANSPFLAVVGDQKSGVNVETPLTTMIEAFNTALDSRGGSFGGNIEIPLIIGEREFGRAVIKASDLERARTTGGRIGTKVVYG